MKTFIRLLVFTSFSFLFLMSANQTHASEVEPKLTDSLLIFGFSFAREPTMPGNAVPLSFGTMMIRPKTSEDQYEFERDDEHGFTYVRIKEKNFDEIDIFLQNQSNKWHVCESGKGFSDRNLIQAIWSVAGKGVMYCLTSREALPLFDELSRVSLSSDGKEFSRLVIDARDSL